MIWDPARPKKKAVKKFSEWGFEGKEGDRGKGWRIWEIGVRKKWGQHLARS